MLPGNVVSTTAIIGRIQHPDGLVINDLTDYEYGGIALNDATQGLLVKPWVCRYEESAVVLDSDGTAPEVVYERAGITALSLAFDQNMRPILAYEADGQSWLWWWDSLTNARRTDSFGPVRCPRVTLDDKRPSATEFGTSDVIFAYIREDKLCYRQQRDRFGIERVLRYGVSRLSRLHNMGLTDKMRFQFELV